MRLERHLAAFNIPLVSTPVETDRMRSKVPTRFSCSSTISTLDVDSHAWLSLYPEPNRIGPRPRTQWIRRLNWLIKQADLNRNSELLKSLRTPKSGLNRDELSSENGYHHYQDIIDTDPISWVINSDDGVTLWAGVRSVVAGVLTTQTHLSDGKPQQRHGRSDSTLRVRLIIDQRNNRSKTHQSPDQQPSSSQPPSSSSSSSSSTSSRPLPFLNHVLIDPPPDSPHKPQLISCLNSDADQSRWPINCLSFSENGSSPAAISTQFTVVQL
ncbi:hypothetical protein PPACK8108_LOCUS14982 [Phakopsora pachyrhizi]|uniref:Uncharacterized protein n=1 Tax=Phakopsora pachyrhizi TaxID=170000 RepID=A0AAV0B7A6_PHAPC|nr:hypothetical protein PPACK8108_LOCUS14982 [Phakopsora pachyrhizi]